MVRQASVYKIGHFNKQDIRELCPTLSNSSIEKAFRDLIAIGETQQAGKDIRSMSLDVCSTSSHSLSAERKTPSFAAHIKDYRIVDSPSPSLEKVNSNSLFCTTHGFHCLHLGLKSFPSADCMQSQLTGSSHRSSNYWPSNIYTPRIHLKANTLKILHLFYPQPFYSRNPLHCKEPTESMLTSVQTEEPEISNQPFMSLS